MIYKILILIILIISSHATCLSETYTRESDSLELIKFYYAFDGPNWRNQAGWLSDSLISQWYGINTEYVIENEDSILVVTSIILNWNYLRGELIKLNLPDLVQLNLGSNGLDSIIDKIEFPKLKHLDLSDNKFSGPFPELTLSELEVLNLSKNLFDTVPENIIAPKLTSLNLSSNLLTGNIPEIRSPQLVELYIQGNKLTGDIPALDLPNLEILDMSNNELTGNIPDYNYPKLKVVYLMNNKLTGGIPNFKLDSLTELDLSVNNISGEIPQLDLPNLTKLNFQNNELSGSIPNLGLPKIEEIDFSYNNLEGNIPNFDMSSLKILTITHNNLTGQIPAFEMPKIIEIRLNNNQFTGIPIFNLPGTLVIDLSHNLLSGDIPDFIFNMRARINLSYNQLDGKVPNFTNILFAELDLSNNRLTELQALSNLGRQTKLIVSSNKLTFIHLWLNHTFFDFTYAPQDTILPIAIKEDGYLYNLTVIADEPANTFQWQRNGVDIPDATGLTIVAGENGRYNCLVNNGILTELTLYSDTVEVIISGVEHEKPVSNINSFPNPFSESATIEYNLTEPAFVRINIYNSIGTEVASPVDEFRFAGINRAVFDAENLPPGMYYYTIQTGERIESGTMILVR